MHSRGFLSADTQVLKYSSVRIFREREISEVCAIEFSFLAELLISVFVFNLVGQYGQACFCII